MDLFQRFDDIKVGLVGTIDAPYETSVASARTCYSSRGIIYPQEVSKDERAANLRDKIASSTLQAGHLTTRQHAHFVFSIEGVSRHCLWTFLHSHPFYNSEQVSQRYVKVKKGSFVRPPLPDSAQPLFEKVAECQMQAYETLISHLRVPLTEDYFERFKARKNDPAKWSSQIDKRAYEVARYVLGVGTSAYLYHTVSSLSLLRYARLIHLFETPQEQKILVQKMLDCVLAHDPLFEKELQDAVPLESTLEYQFVSASSTQGQASQEFIEAFDSALEGATSRLISYPSQIAHILGTSLRTALGKLPQELSDDDAVAKLLDPAQNPLLADTLNLTTQDRLSQALHHIHFVFKKKLSHTADSQDQRHRLTPSSRPLLRHHYTGKPDYITPFGITQSAEAHELYAKTMEASFEGINQLLDQGVDFEAASYLLPNAFPIRFVSSGTLIGLHHKWKLRSCYNAQEEIFKATLDEIKAVQKVAPQVAQFIKAPCFIRNRAGIKPYCPEGDRFCGVPVWKKNIEDYSRKSL